MSFENGLPRLFNIGSEVICSDRFTSDTIATLVNEALNARVYVTAVAVNKAQLAFERAMKRHEDNMAKLNSGML